MKNHLATLLACSLSLIGSAAYSQTLLLDYNFNNGTAADSSGNGRNGTLVGTAVVAGAGSGVSGLSGDRAFFNDSLPGSSGQLNYTNASGLSGLTSFTISLWYYNDYATTSGRLFENSGSGGNNTSLILSSANTLQLNFGGGGAELTASNSLIAQNDTWSYIAITFDASLASNQLKLYAGSYDGMTLTNASLISQATYASTTALLAANGDTLVFANRPSGDRELTGLLDDIQIYGSTSGSASALSLSQIQGVQASAVPEPSVAALAMIGLGLILRRRSTR